MKKRLKGFTLVEVIVAFAVFSVMALLLATMFASIGRSTLKTNSANTKIDKQFSSAEASRSDLDIITPTPVTITFGATSVQINAYEQDKVLLAQARIHVAGGTATDEEKKMVAEADTPDFKYFKVTP